MRHNIVMEAYATHMRSVAISRGVFDEPGMRSRGDHDDESRGRRRRSRRRRIADR